MAATERAPMIEKPIALPAHETIQQYRTAEWYEKYLYGGISCMIGSFILNPVDVVKVRLQLQGELTDPTKLGQLKKYNGFTRGLLTTFQEEGIRGLGRGMTASMMREATYSTIRYGAYDPIKDALITDGGNSRGLSFPLYKKVIAGGIAGALGAAVANPTDLIKVRMQAPYVPGQTARYAHTWDAIRQIYTTEGVRGFYKGVGPTTLRACVLTGTQLPSYDHSKHLLLSTGWLKDGMAAHFVCAMFAGLVCSTSTSPIDVVKSRIMNQPTDAFGRGLHYSSPWDCWVKTYRAEGPRG